MERPKVDISIGLIRKLGDEGWRWLARWDESKKHFDFVTAKRLEQESAREAISREVAWTLDLDRGRDILVCNMAQSNLEMIEQLPGEKFESHLKVAFYNIELYRESATDKVNEDRNVAWLTSQEICQGKTNDNLPMSPRLTYLIGKSQVIQNWESST